MIKTVYYMWRLTSLFLYSEGVWQACYTRGRVKMFGSGDSPEAAVADAQRKIQLAERE